MKNPCEFCKPVFGCRQSCDKWQEFKKELQRPCQYCPDRIPPTKEDNGCRATCEEWKQYEEAHREELRQNMVQQEIDMYVFDNKSRQIEYMRRHSLRKW